MDEQIAEMLIRRMDKIDERLERLERKAANWQGGLLMLVSLGGLVTWLVNVYDKWRFTH